MVQSATNAICGQTGKLISELPQISNVCKTQMQFNKVCQKLDIKIGFEWIRTRLFLSNANLLDLCHGELNGLWGIFVEQTFFHKYGKKVQQNSHYHWTGIQLYVYSLLLYEVYHLFHKIHKSKLWRLFVSAHCNIRLIFSTEFPTQYLFCGRLSNDWLNLPNVQRTFGKKNKKFEF